MIARKKYANENPNPAPQTSAPVIAITPPVAQKACQNIPVSIPAPTAALPHAARAARSAARETPSAFVIGDIVSWKPDRRSADAWHVTIGIVVDAGECDESVMISAYRVSPDGDSVTNVVLFRRRDEIGAASLEESGAFGLARGAFRLAVDAALATGGLR